MATKTKKQQNGVKKAKTNKKQEGNLNLLEIFKEAQNSMREHSLLINKIKQLTSSVFDFIFPYLSIYLSDVKSNTSSSRLQSFFTKLFSDKEILVEDSNYLSNILKTLSLLSSSSKKHVRLKSLALICSVLENLPEETEITDTLYEDLLETLLERIKDKNSLVRMESVKAIYRLQNPESIGDMNKTADVSFSRITENTKVPFEIIKCPVMQSLIKMSLYDESVNIRAIAIEKLALTKYTLPFVFRRYRDISPVVRAKVYQIISKKTRMKSLKLVNRINLLNYGLKDRDEAVNSECLKLLENWVKEEGGLLNVVKNFDEKTTRLIIESLSFMNFQFYENDILKEILSETTVERSCLLKAVLHYSKGNVEIELIKYVEIVDNIFSEDQSEPNLNVVLYLISALYRDDSFNTCFVYDDTSVKKLQELLLKILRCEQINNIELLKEIIKMLSILFSIKELNEIVMDKISELYGSSESNEDALKEAMDIRKKIISLNLLENLLSLKANLKSLKEGDPILQESLNQYVIKSVVSVSPFLRDISLKCLTPFILIQDEDSQYLSLLLNILNHDQDALKLTVLEVLFDYLLVKANTEESKKTEIINNIAEFLYSENNILMGNAVEGFIKLFINGIIYDCKILSTIILLFFNPTTMDNNLLRQTCSLFFKYYISSVCNCGGRNDNKEEGLRKQLIYTSIMPCIKAVLNAPTGSPLQNINLNQLTGLLMQMTGICNGMEKLPVCIEDAKRYYKNFLFDIGYEVLAFPDKQSVNDKFIEIFFKLELQSLFTENSGKKEVLELVGNILKNGEKNGINRKNERNLRKFIISLKNEPIDNDDKDIEVEGEEVLDAVFED